MARIFFKKMQFNKKIYDFIEKHNLPKGYLSINRRSVVYGLLIGIFIGFIPMPFQMLLVLSATLLTKFNVPLAISMVWLSNPLTMPFMYYLEYKTGLFILGEKGAENIELTLSWFSDNWETIILPLYIGTVFYATIVSFTVAFTVNFLWKRSLMEEKKAKGRRKK